MEQVNLLSFDRTHVDFEVNGNGGSNEPPRLLRLQHLFDVDDRLAVAVGDVDLVLHQDAHHPIGRQSPQQQRQLTTQWPPVTGPRPTKSALAGGTLWVRDRSLRHLASGTTEP